MTRGDEKISDYPITDKVVKFILKDDRQQKAAWERKKKNE
jgi:hypothetical protein